MGIVNDIAKKELNIDVGYSTDQYDYHLTLPPIDINLSCFGRENDIEKILRRLEKEKLLIVVNGIGGIGKTRLCKYIYRAAEKQTTPIKFDHIAWLNYSNNLMDSFIHAFPPDWIPSTNATREEKYRYILRKINSLAEKKNVLLIIDNVDRLPSSDLKLGTITQLRCYVIVTSRLKVMEKNIYSLGLLVPSAAEELFLWYYTYDYAGRDHEISDILPALLNLCGFHAMTIELMAKSFNTGKIKIISAYQQLVKNHFDLSVFTEKITTDWDNETMDTSISKHIGKLFSIMGLPSKEKELLYILSLFSPTDFPITSLIHILGKQAVPDSLTNIIKKGWINCENDIIVMHASVKFAIQYACRKTSVIKYTYLLENLSQELHWSNSPAEITRLISHAEAAFISFEKSHAFQLISLTSKISDYHLYEGDLKSSIYFLEKQISILKAFPNHEKDVAECFKKIGSQYQELGNAELAYKFHKKCLKIRKQFYLPISFERAECYAHIAFYYQEIGQYWKALSNAKRAFDIRLRIYGPEHEITAWSYNNLALLYFHLFEYKKALTFINYGIQIRETIFHKSDADIGKHELDVAQSKSIRGLIYQALGMFEKAYIDQNDAMKIRIRRLNEKHIFTATSYCRVVSSLCCRDDFKDLDYALDLAERAIKIDVVTTGENTIDTAEAYLAKARILRRKKEYSEAIELFLHSINIIEIAYRKNHPRLSKIQEELGDVYLEYSNPSQAQLFYQRAYHIRALFLPSNHWAVESVKEKLRSL